MKAKKTVSSLLAIGIAVSLLAGCGAASSSTNASTDGTSSAGGTETTSSGEPIVLKMWGGVPAENGPQAACDAYNELHKDEGIQIEYERFVNDDTGNVKLETNIMGGSEIDLYMSYSMTQMNKRAEGNMALDLTDLCARDGFDLHEYLGTLADNYQINGKPYGLPCKLDQFGLVLNKDMFDAAGIDIPTDWTYDEFLDVCKKLTHGEGEDKVYGMFWNTQQDLMGAATYLLCQTLGGDNMYNADGTATIFDDPVWEKTVSLINTTMQEGYAPTHADSVSEKLTQEGMFLGQKSAMTIGSWMVRSIKDTATYPHDFVTAFAPYPVAEEGQRNYTQGGYGDLLCINPRSEHIDEAWEFAKWYMNEGTYYLVSGGRVPASNAFDVDTVTKAFLNGSENLFDAESVSRVLIAPHDNYAAPTINTKNNEIKDIYNREIEAVLIGQESVADGLTKVKEQSDKLLAG